MLYARQDKVSQPGEPLSINVIGNIFNSLEVANLFTVLSHLYGKDETTKTKKPLQAFFKARVHDVSPIKLFGDYLKNEVHIDDPIVISPDDGGRRIGRELAGYLECGWKYFEKERDKTTGAIIKMDPVDIQPEDVNGKSVIILDDVTATGFTIMAVQKKINEQFKPKEEYVALAHVMYKRTLKRLDNCDFTEILTTDSLATDPNSALKYERDKLTFTKNENLTEISIVGLVADYVKSL
jgi:ribose-phosphate pyrophosphokinase